MIPFDYHEAEDLQDASEHIDHDHTQAIAGGTTMVDLMKLNVLAPEKLVHVRNILPKEVTTTDGHIDIGAGCTMSELALAAKGETPFPVIRQSLILAASPQIRNMATMGGNLLQRPRSPYFRHPDMPIEGREVKNFGENVDTSLCAILGNEGRLVSVYPGDFAVALAAFDGSLQLHTKRAQQGSSTRQVKAREFYQLPAQSFSYNPDLKPGDIIHSIRIPITESLKNSVYFKVRERSSYAFALVSVALGLEIEGGKIRDAHVGFGGLSPIPWHSPEAEKALVGQAPDDTVFTRAAEAALASAKPPHGLEYKVPLARHTLVRALKTLRDHGPMSDEQLWAQQHGRSISATSAAES